MSLMPYWIMPMAFIKFYMLSLINLSKKRLPSHTKLGAPFIRIFELSSDKTMAIESPIN